MRSDDDLITVLSAPEDDWPTLIRLDVPDLLSLDVNQLPVWAGDFANALSESMETPTELAGGMVLATCAAAAARRLKVQVKPGYFEPLNLWVVVALGPANSKSPVQSKAAAPLQSWSIEQSKLIEPEVQRAQSERKTQEARINEMRRVAAREKDAVKYKEQAEEIARLESGLPEIPTAPQLWTSDSTPERLGALLAENDECMAWLSSEGGVFDLLQGRYSDGILNLDLMLKSHSADAERVDRGSRPPVHLEYPRLTIGLTPQPDVLRGLGSKPGFRGRGLLARFLYFLPSSRLGYRQGSGPPVPEEVRDAYETGVRAMLDWDAGDVREVRLGDDALELWNEFWQAVEAKMRPGGAFAQMTDWAGKAPGSTARIAGVLHAIKHAHGSPWDHVVTSETMESALEIMAVFCVHSRWALNVMGANTEVAGARSVWDRIEQDRSPEFSERDLFSKLRGQFTKMAELRPALAILEERGYVKIAHAGQDGPGRKPSPRLRVRPELSETWL